MSEGNKTVCPKCGKGQIVCTYRWKDRHTWSHDCTNPYCGMHEGFSASEEGDEDDIYDERGPGEKGGCPGHGKPASKSDEEEQSPDDAVTRHVPEGDDEEY